jgi:hypothetical protein
MRIWLRVNIAKTLTTLKAQKNKTMAFKIHMMYKGEQSIKALTNKDHLSLKKRGFSHTKPKKNKVNKPKPKY